jgi:predicted MFS family arabinose efflux permease
MSRAAVLAPLAHRQFRLLVGGQAVSSLGDWLDFLGVIVLVVFVWQHGSTGLALVAIAVAAPWVVLSPFAGAWADRLPARPVLVGCDLARAALVLCYLLAPNLPVLLVLLALKSSFGAVFGPAQQVLIKRTVPARDLLAANALSTFVNQATKVAGPAIGGLLVAGGGPHRAFVADAITFGLSALILVRLPSPAGSRGRPAAGLLASVSAGWTVIVGRRALLLAVTAMTTSVFLVFTFDTLSPLALARLGLGAPQLGLGFAALGLGGILGTLGFSQYGRRVSPLALLGGSQAGIGLLVSVLGAAAAGQVVAPPLVWYAVLAGVGVGAAGILTAFPYILQREAPAEALGRVSAAAAAPLTVAQVVAPPVGGLLASRYGVGTTFVLAGGALLVAGIALVLAGDRLAPAGAPLVPAEAEVVAHLAPSTGAGAPEPAELPLGALRSGVVWWSR